MYLWSFGLSFTEDRETSTVLNAYVGQLWLLFVHICDCHGTHI